MIIHALQILRKELEEFLKPVTANDDRVVELGNVAPLDKIQGEAIGNDSNKVLITLINVREEKALKNGPFSRRNDTTLQTEYFNPPVFLNLHVLISANQVSYVNALIYLSRIAAFFQSKNVFTHLNSVEVSDSDVPATEQMETFKIILDLYSPSFEELNHIWGTLGGKQVPSLVYALRLVEISPRKLNATGGLVEEVILNVHEKNAN
ncbi:MAG: DUF4255 domain-containing protein [Saprospiraceae bacterium]|nr:DUF4255 domain-containing protein [Saprospiraceae bacterium]MCF8249987.1 DUF4255 domain-containing protein [Saprospiraceae bacterium]MCF8278973.1 DUF4255 domain-containing protein [Bacteroidales bacterium]MCF8311000.1 DUF4255 domain-containing protein [Saprospiraceae bacterium]MCF8439664.1 DUF4255 domain-containing protein [Saprospiraceae bacterium]